MRSKEFLLDTNIIIEFIHDNRTVVEAVLKVGIAHCHLSVITLYELYFGAYNASQEKYRNQELERIEMIRAKFDILPLADDASIYGQIKTDLKRKGQMIDDFDIIIGANARYYGMTAVTDNLEHFERIPNIKIENWVNR